MVIILVIVFLSACRNEENYTKKSFEEESNRVQNYVKEKYGFDSVVLEIPTVSTGNMGNIDITVQRKDMPDVIFSVSRKGIWSSEITEDNYKEIFELYEFNQSYLTSPLYQQAQTLGFEHSFLDGWTYHDHDGNLKKEAMIYLFRPGIKGTETYHLSKEEWEMVQTLKEQLNTIGYELSQVIINDSEFAKYTNEYDYRKSGAIYRDIRIDL